MRNYLISFVFTIPVFFSCAGIKKTVYFPEIKDSASFNEIPAPEYIIQRNDLLNISVSSIDSDASQMFNLTNQPIAKSFSTTDELLQSSGYLVNNEGYIRFLVLGLIKAEGLTKEQLTVNIRNMISERKLLVDPVIIIRHLNYKVTVLGEVNRPGVISVPTESITLLDALGKAGDLTIYARRNTVLLIRTEGGKRLAQRIDLNSNDIFNSPYYNLKPNDVVYVEHNKAKVMSASRFNLFIPAVGAGLSVLIYVIDRLNR